MFGKTLARALLAAVVVALVAIAWALTTAVSYGQGPDVGDKIQRYTQGAQEYTESREKIVQEHKKDLESGRSLFGADERWEKAMETTKSAWTSSAPTPPTPARTGPLRGKHGTPSRTPAHRPSTATTANPNGLMGPGEVATRRPKSGIMPPPKPLPAQTTEPQPERDVLLGTLAGKSPLDFKIDDWGCTDCTFQAINKVSKTECIGRFTGIAGRAESEVMLLRGFDMAKVTDGARFVLQYPVVIRTTYNYTTVADDKKTVLVLERDDAKINEIIEADRTEKDRKAAEKREDADERAKAKHDREDTIEEAKWHTWTDATGTHHIEAKFQSMAAGNVKLIKRDGSALTLPLEKLSDEDQEWIRNRPTISKRLKDKGTITAVTAPTVTAPAVTAPIVGKWVWPGGDIAEFKQDGTAKWLTDGGMGTWICLDQKTRKYLVSWRNGSVDSMVMSSDGNTCACINARDRKPFTVTRSPKLRSCKLLYRGSPVPGTAYITHLAFNNCVCCPRSSRNPGLIILYAVPGTRQPTVDTDRSNPKEMPCLPNRTR